ncbi:MAG: tetratricopeptide repeat protein [Longimicrobiales bacterium]
MKALRSEPDQRYASVQELANDIRRYLSGHAVIARGQARTYRVSRFARRHRWALAAASAFVFLLSAYAGTVTAQARRIRSALDQVTVEARKAEQVTEFMLGLFKANDPAEARGDTITARELLDRGVARARWLDGQPELQAQMLDLVGQVRTELGVYAQARPVLEQALATRRRTLGSQHPEVGESLHHLASLAYLSGEHPHAITLHREALALRRKTLGPGHPKTLGSLFALATATHEGGDHAAGKTLFEEWIAAQSSRSTAMSTDDADQLEALGTLLTYSGDPDDFDRAEPLLQRALAIRKSIYGPAHPQVAISLADLGTLLSRKGDLKTAEQLMRESLEIRRAIYPANHREIAQGLIDLATPLEHGGRFDETADVLREALSIQLTRGEDHMGVASMKRMLGRVLMKSGEHEEAESLLRDAVRAHSEQFGTDYPLTVRARFYLGDVLRAQGAFDEAEPLLVEAYDHYLKARGANSRATRMIAESLEKLYEATDRPAEAARYRALLTVR